MTTASPQERSGRSPTRRRVAALAVAALAAATLLAGQLAGTSAQAPSSDETTLTVTGRHPDDDVQPVPELLRRRAERPRRRSTRR